MVKEVVVLIKLQIKGGQVNLVFLVGFVFGVKGVNIMEFCKQYNVCMQDKFGKVFLCVIMVYSDKLFDFVIKIFLVVVQIIESVKLKKGFLELNKSKVGIMIWDQVCIIVEDKLLDMNCFIVDVVMLMVVGIVCSMGVIVKGGEVLVIK